ncbi:uncharacterized protein LOC134830523 [Culicoides brevitarsis]|uniref:uncharacterized protein LOC134830523 n=1 Tax=Culicoides brevitarsis TaxID=469753 RepID=UPI00307BE3A0
MKLQRTFILLCFLAWFEGYNCFVFEAIDMISNLYDYGVKLKELFEKEDDSGEKLDNIIGNLTDLSKSVDKHLNDIIANQEIAPLLTKWWSLRVQFGAKMDAIYRDIPRNLSDVECNAIANSVIGDNADAIHQIIQQLHDTLLTHDNGALFKYMTKKIEATSVPFDTMIYKFYLAVMALEAEAAIGLEFQFEVFKHVHPDHNMERQDFEKSKSKQRIEKIKTTFKNFFKAKKPHIKRETFKMSNAPFQFFCTDRLYTRPGYVITDITFDCYSEVRQYLIQVHYWYTKVQFSKVGSFGLVDPSTSVWVNNCCGNSIILPTNLTLETKNVPSSNGTYHYALSEINYVAQYEGPGMDLNVMFYNYDTFQFQYQNETQNNKKTGTHTPVQKAILSVLLLDKKLIVELHRFDYSTLM